jgi:hypothetical protein
VNEGATACDLPSIQRNELDGFRTAYVRLFVDEVVVSPDEIRITGSKTALERALVCSDDEPGGAVPIFDREWCRLRDSNPRPHHYE